MVIGGGGRGKMYGGEYPMGINVQGVIGRRAIVLGVKGSEHVSGGVNIWGGGAYVLELKCIVCNGLIHFG